MKKSLDTHPSKVELERRRAAFRALHEKGCFVIPNPWDPGSARYLRHLGFKALATTSAGFAFSRGLPDNGSMTREVVLAHLEDMVASVDLPLNADFQNGYAHAPEGVADSVRLCVGTGVAGLSIEDSTGDKARPLYDLPLAVERIRAALAAIHASGTGVLLTARAECYIVGHPDPLRESVRRLEAYAEAGADVLYAPGPSTPEAIREIVRAAGGKPVNVLVRSSTGLTVNALAEMGVRRISVGAALARAAWTAFIRAAETIARGGVFTGFEGLVAHDMLDSFFGA
jgi:2-methylisocitrate lyase-like PEP mutase family enzyme